MKTAVEWLYDELKKGSMTSYLVKKEHEKILEQAKEMEKEQIEKSHIDGGKNKRTAVKYYNETFKSE